MVISKGNCGHGEFKNVLPLSEKIPYLPVRYRKLPRFTGGSIGPRTEICRTSGLQILKVPRLHQSNGYMKKKLRAWTVQKCITLVGADTVLTVWSRKVPCGMGCCIRPRMEVCGISDLPIPIVPHLDQKNGSIKRRLRAWRV